MEDLPFMSAQAGKSCPACEKGFYQVSTEITRLISAEARLMQSRDNAMKRHPTTPCHSERSEESRR
jgi:hypothetical protein